MSSLNIGIKGHEKQYSILIGSDLIGQFKEHLDLSSYSSIAVLTDTHLAENWLPKLKEGIGRTVTEIIIPPGEKYKNIDTVQTIWKKLYDEKCDRKSLLINLGGGVIGDMGGFAASTYMRGIDFIQVPTTLLAQVDASVGGKLGIDFSGGKNIIGSFQQPKAVIIDVETLKTLPKREFISGFAEIIKHGLIYDELYFHKVTSKAPETFSVPELITIIERSCQIKSTIVMADETETGVRKILNFGHTVGHAIESLKLETDQPLLHGEAIAIGMIAEAKISELMGYINSEDFQTIQNSIEKAGLPISVHSLSIPDILEKMKVDKKNSHGKIKWTLLTKIGDADFNMQIGEHFVKEAINYISKS